MKRFYIVSAITMAIFFVACSPGKKTTGVWINKEKIEGKSYNNIFIIVMTADIQARQRVESELANAVTARGHKAVKSIDVMPMDINNPKTPSKEEVVSKVKASGCDAVFVASLLKKEESAKFTPGATAYNQMPNYTYGGNYYGYYSNWYPTVATSDYYAHDKKYFMQSNFYDVASEELMWTVQSEVFNPSNLDRFSKTYTNTLISKLREAKLLKE